ncbi:YARHG domain-containing protein [Flagellimonas sp.]|uniref:YARHG domain-containing protein n=1 Tax=Flagellimonas sp. TaxID=2058762 RepID=UPI003BB07547
MFKQKVTGLKLKTYLSVFMYFFHGFALIGQCEIPIREENRIIWHLPKDLSMEFEHAIKYRDVDSWIDEVLIEKSGFRVVILAGYVGEFEAGNEFSDGGSYTQYYLVLIDECNNPLSARYIGTNDDYIMQFSYQFVPSKKLLVTSIHNLESYIKQYYELYQISDEGNINKLDSNPIATQPFNKEQLRLFDQEYLRILRNTIFAVNGYIFKSKDMKDYFSEKPWYDPRYNNVNHLLSEVQLKNLCVIQEVEKEKRNH